jgi:hypothetical protein
VKATEDADLATPLPISHTLCIILPAVLIVLLGVIPSLLLSPLVRVFE